MIKGVGAQSTEQKIEGGGGWGDKEAIAVHTTFMYIYSISKGG